MQRRLVLVSDPPNKSCQLSWRDTSSCTDRPLDWLQNKCFWNSELLTWSVPVGTSGSTLLSGSSGFCSRSMERGTFTPTNICKMRKLLLVCVCRSRVQRQNSQEPRGHLRILHNEILGVEPSLSLEGCRSSVFDVRFTILPCPEALL